MAGLPLHSTGVGLVLLAHAEPAFQDDVLARPLVHGPEQVAVSPAALRRTLAEIRRDGRHALGPSYAGVTPHPFEVVAATGIAVASVDYRLSGEALWPAQLHDAKAAVRWLRSRADEVGVDPTRIAAWGESAGGHLASLLGLTGSDPALGGDVGITGPSSAVVAVVAWYAPSKLSTDRLVPHRQSELLHAALATAGGPVELHVLPGADHMWLGSTDAAATALRLSTDFLARTLGAGDQNTGDQS